VVESWGADVSAFGERSEEGDLGKLPEADRVAAAR